MSKIVVTIPYWESDSAKRGVLKRCVSSLKGHDEIIVLAGKQKSLPLAWNMCLELGFGMGADYVILSNDDIELVRGDLSMLCRPNEVVSPAVNGGFFKIFHAHIFAIPKNIWEKVGAFDERFEVYWADTDYARRMVDEGINVTTNDSVNVLHPEPARTLQHAPSGVEATDRSRFIEKWGRAYIDPIKEC